MLKYSLFYESIINYFYFQTKYDNTNILIKLIILVIFMLSQIYVYFILHFIVFYKTKYILFSWRGWQLQLKLISKYIQNFKFCIFIISIQIILAFFIIRIYEHITGKGYYIFILFFFIGCSSI
jgi:hypothetical protein